MSSDNFQIYMFHFRCPICGATPKRVILRDYLHEWSAASPERLYSLICAFIGALVEVRDGQSRWLTKNFGDAVNRIESSLNELPFDPPPLGNSCLRLTPSSSLSFEARCPVCSTPPGPRNTDKYFKDWPHACRVQTGNLLYETGLMLWAVLLGLPTWAPGSFLQQLNSIRSEIRETGKAMSLLECPQCGRLTTCLYGSNARQNGFCRWCLDTGGGVGLALTISVDSEGRATINMAKRDHTAPAKNAWDILPPEISRQKE